MLESYQHSENCFLTLTYENEEQINLEPKDLQDFFKRLRVSIYPHKVRYYAVGEYGDKSGRPHYHVALFGHPTCNRGRSSFRRKGNGEIVCCAVCDQMRLLWKHGLVDLARIEPASARYIAGYVIKKMNKHDDERLEGRVPEFARMSNRPGLGASAMDEVASTLMLHDYDAPDVPSVLQHGRARLPLGRYLRRQLREKMGRSPDAPKEALEEMEKQVQALREIAKTYAPKGFTDFCTKQEILNLNEGARLNLEAKMHRKAKKGLI